MCVALQILGMPSLIFLDEPTSGLDASSSLELLVHLNRLAESNRTVILTIHQPRLEIFHMFDKIMLLCQGQVRVLGGGEGVRRRVSLFSQLCALETRAQKRATFGQLLYLPFIFIAYSVLLGTVYLQTDSPASLVTGFGIFSCASGLFMFPIIYGYLARTLEVLLGMTGALLLLSYVALRLRHSNVSPRCRNEQQRATKSREVLCAEEGGGGGESPTTADENVLAPSSGDSRTHQGSLLVQCGKCLAVTNLGGHGGGVSSQPQREGGGPSPVHNLPVGPQSHAAVPRESFNPVAIIGLQESPGRQSRAQARQPSVAPNNAAGRTRPGSQVWPLVGTAHVW
ncbi:hypothetical protein EMCRGX_G026816 [Ephydatia muelleri]